MKKVLFWVVLSGGIVMLGALAYAQDHGKHDQMMQMPKSEQKQADAGTSAVNVGNKICPVTGEKIDEKTKVTYEYEGKIYNFCCSMCIEEFKKDPQKYIKKIAEEKQSESKEKSIQGK